MCAERFAAWFPLAKALALPPAARKKHPAYVALTSVQVPPQRVAGAVFPASWKYIVPTGGVLPAATHAVPLHT